MQISANAPSGNGDVYCNVKFSKPAICCDAGQTVDLTKCGVQFAADATMTTGGITWLYDGEVVESFTPAAKGVYSLTAQCGANTKTIYVVAKNADENEYVLYRNDFDADVSGLRVIETTDGATVSVSDGMLRLDSSIELWGAARVLLPEYLDDFGDAIMEASMSMTAAYADSRWNSMMFRVQDSDYPYYQACMRYDLTASSGVEIAQRTPSNKWFVYKNTDFHYGNVGGI